ncbi:hypothetical protein X975_19099, partial [Stegodyphus mimosarum]
MFLHMPDAINDSRIQSAAQLLSEHGSAQRDHLSFMYFFYPTQEVGLPSLGTFCRVTLEHFIILNHSITLGT